MKAARLRQISVLAIVAQTEEMGLPCIYETLGVCLLVVPEVPLVLHVSGVGGVPDVDDNMAEHQNLVLWPIGGVAVAAVSRRVELFVAFECLLVEGLVVLLAV